MLSKILSAIFVALVAFMILGEISPVVANPIQKTVKVEDDGTHIEIGIEMEMNVEVKVNGKPVTSTPRPTPTPTATVPPTGSTATTPW